MITRKLPAPAVNALFPSRIISPSLLLRITCVISSLYSLLDPLIIRICHITTSHSSLKITNRSFQSCYTSLVKQASNPLTRVPYQPGASSSHIWALIVRLWSWTGCWHFLSRFPLLFYILPFPESFHLAVSSSSASVSPRPTSLVQADLREFDHSEFDSHWRR